MANVYNDDWYDQQLEQYKGTAYYDTMAANPYLVRNNAEFSPTLGNFIAEALGDYSARDAYYGNLRNQANQWYAQQLESMRQQDYNSAASQANQLRAAGLNPDLQQVQPGSAAENDQPISPAPDMHPRPDGVSEIASLAQGFLTNVLGLYQSIQQIEGNNLALVGSEIANHNDALGLATSSLVGSISLGDDELDKIRTDPSFADDLLLDAARKFDFSTMSSRTRRIVSRYFNQIQRDPRTNQETLFLKTARAELLNRFAQAQSSNADIMSHKNWNDDLDKMIGTTAELFTQYQDEYQSLYYRYLKKSSENELSLQGQQIALQGQQIKQGESLIPQWEIDKLNNRFRQRFYTKMHSLGTIGSLGSIFLPGLFDSLGSGFKLGASVVKMLK